MTAPGDQLIQIVDYDHAWPTRFAELGVALRRALGGVAVRIDHIGSTSVPGLAAKPHRRQGSVLLADRPAGRRLGPADWVGARTQRRVRHHGVMSRDEPRGEWVVWRQDDNGNRFEVARKASRDEAEALAATMEARGHKQTYWVARSG